MARYLAITIVMIVVAVPVLGAPQRDGSISQEFAAPASHVKLDKPFPEREFFHYVMAERQRIAEAEKKIDEALQGYLLRAHMLISLLRFDEAGNAYKEAIALAPDNFFIQISYAHFNDILSRGPEALEAYRSALEIARRSEDPADTAATLLDLGVFYLRQGQKAQAREVLIESSNIYDALAVQDPLVSSRIKVAKNLLNSLLADN